MNDICNSDNNSYPLTAKARRVNLALDRFFTLAFQADGRWTWDDLSVSTVPIETLNLVSGTQSYNLSALTSDILKLLRVEVVQDNDDAIDLTRLDRNLVTGALTEYMSTNGTPAEYDLVGNFIYLYPAPNYAKTNGLRFYFNRNKVAFISTDTSKTLPVPSLFNKYICNHASLPYLIEAGKAHKNDIAALIANDEVAILKYFARREPNENYILMPEIIDSM